LVASVSKYRARAARWQALAHAVDNRLLVHRDPAPSPPRAFMPEGSQAKQLEARRHLRQGLIAALSAARMKDWMASDLSRFVELGGGSCGGLAREVGYEPAREAADFDRPASQAPPPSGTDQCRDAQFLPDRFGLIQNLLNRSPPPMLQLCYDKK
jgi:hypothetical protein